MGKQKFVQNKREAHMQDDCWRVLACLGLFGVGMADERLKCHWPKNGCSSEVRNG